MNNNIVLGDFNIHVNKIDSDENASIFMETAEALGLHQHVQFGTYKCGNTLDLIFTEAGSSITIISCNQGPYISDHPIINCSTTNPAEEVKKETITFRKFKKFDPEKFFRDINLKVNPDTTIDNIVNDINQQKTMVLDEHVPFVTKTITTHYINPWFDEELREQRRIV